MVVLLLAALVLFTARMGDLSLPSLEDAFYGREAVEMARSGRIYTVTWNGEPTHQHPPLHLWLVARTFDALGERDLAARLPTVLLALGTLLLTWRIGVLTLGRAAAVAGMACLLATPIFVDNARRLMMEVPLTFWIAATVWVYLEARERPRWQVALAIPLGAAILTKSVLGLMPLLALVGALASEELRAPLRRPWVWIGLALGLAIGASWLAHQWWTQGSGAVASHLLAHVVRRSTRSFRLRALRRLPADPAEVLPAGHPARPPRALARPPAARPPARRRSRPGRLDHPAGRALQLLVLPDAAVHLPHPAAARPLRRPRPRHARPARGRAPHRAAGSDRRGRRRGCSSGGTRRSSRGTPTPSSSGTRPTIQALAPAGEPVPYLGNHYWATANPLLYYAERVQAPSSPSAREAVEAARRHPGRLLLVTRRRLPELLAVDPPREVVLEGRDWVLLRLGGAGGGSGG